MAHIVELANGEMATLISVDDAERLMEDTLGREFMNEYRELVAEQRYNEELEFTNEEVDYCYAELESLHNVFETLQDSLLSLDSMLVGRINKKRAAEVIEEMSNLISQCI